MKNFILTVLVAFTGMTSFAGPRIVGNGGIAVEDDGKLYMLDLYERSVHIKPYYQKDVKTFRHVQETMERLVEMANLPDAPTDLLILKMNEIYGKNYLLGFYFEASLTKIDWRLVDADLVPTEDVRTPLDGLKLKQVAIRVGNIVYISEKYWNNLDDNNKLALLLHEAAYFFVAPTLAEGTLIQNAVTARSITGSVFTKRFAMEGSTVENTGMSFPKIMALKNKTTELSNVDLKLTISKDINVAYDSVNVRGFTSMGQVTAKLNEAADALCDNLAYRLMKRSEDSTELKIGIETAEVEYTPLLKTYLTKMYEEQTFLKIAADYNTIGPNALFKVKKSFFKTTCSSLAKQQIKNALSPYTWSLQ